VCGIRWKIEEFHRELKQLTGVRLSVPKLAFREITLVVPCWSEFKAIAYQACQTIYQIKHGCYQTT